MRVLGRFREKRSYGITGPFRRDRMSSSAASPRAVGACNRVVAQRVKGRKDGEGLVAICAVSFNSPVALEYFISFFSLRKQKTESYFELSLSSGSLTYPAVGALSALLIDPPSASSGVVCA